MKKFISLRAAFLCMLFASVCGLSFTSMVSPVVEKEAVIEYSGEDLYRAVFLLSGPVAQQIPEIKKLDYHSYIENEALLSKIEIVYDRIVDEVNREAPSYMMELEQAVGTKNPLNIYQSIKKGKKITADVFERLNFKGNGNVVLASLSDIDHNQIPLEDLETELVKKMEHFSEVENAFETTSEIPVCTGLIVYPFPFLCDIVVQYVIPRNSSQEANDLRDERLAAFLAKIQ
ncbi:MAG: hypothetical protein AAFO82_13870 [Bacteroidota bacterium]